MTRPISIDDHDLLMRLSGVFKDVGYQGATLSMLAAASGLKKASLYHRFPNGKQQMAEDALAAALGWYYQHVLTVLNGKGSVNERIALVVRNLNDFYENGAQACLFNMLASPRGENGPISTAIQAAFEALIDGFAKVAHDAGQSREQARATGERAVILLQGSLVVGRGLNSNAPFRNFSAQLVELFK